MEIMGSRAEGRHQLSQTSYFSLLITLEKKKQNPYNVVPSTYFLMKELLICSSPPAIYFLRCLAITAGKRAGVESLILQFIKR